MHKNVAMQKQLGIANRAIMAVDWSAPGFSAVKVRTSLRECKEGSSFILCV
jgi:hypothetical protein